MIVLGFTLTFHTPFRVGDSYGRDGVDAAIDHDDPLPADHLKGLMRAAANRILTAAATTAPMAPGNTSASGGPAGAKAPAEPVLVQEVFGSPQTPSPWAWTSAIPLLIPPPGSPQAMPQPRHPVHPAQSPGASPPAPTDPRTAWVPGLRHRVKIDLATGSARKDHLVLGEQVWTPQAHFEVHRVGRLDLQAERRQVALLRIAAAGMHAVGAWRRRGLGWVGVTPDDGSVSDLDLALVTEAEEVP